MANEAKAWWERNAREFQAMAQLPIAVIYGTHVNEEKLQLIGPVAGKHLLELGCGGAQCGIAFASPCTTVKGKRPTPASLLWQARCKHDGPYQGHQPVCGRGDGKFGV
jgi:hypothetical protein